MAHTRYVLLSFPTWFWMWRGSEPGLRGDALRRSTNQCHPAALERAELPASASLLSARCSSPAALPVTPPGTPRADMAGGHLLPPRQHLRVSRLSWAPWLLLQEGPGRAVLRSPPRTSRIRTWLGPTAGQGVKVEVLGRRGRWDVWRPQHRSSVGSRTGRNRPLSSTLAIPCAPSLHHPCQRHTAVGTWTPKGHPVPIVTPSWSLGRAAKPLPRPWLLVVLLLSL